MRAYFKNAPSNNEGRKLREPATTLFKSGFIRKVCCSACSHQQHQRSLITDHLSNEPALSSAACLSFFSCFCDRRRRCWCRRRTCVILRLFFSFILASQTRLRGTEGGTSTELRVTMSKRRGTAVYYWDPPLKFVLLSEHVCTPQGSFPFANNATLQTSQLSSAGRSSTEARKLACTRDTDREPSCFWSFVASWLLHREHHCRRISFRTKENC